MLQLPTNVQRSAREGDPPAAAATRVASAWASSPSLAGPPAAAPLAAMSPVSAGMKAVQSTSLSEAREQQRGRGGARAASLPSQVHTCFTCASVSTICSGGGLGERVQAAGGVQKGKEFQHFLPLFQSSASSRYGNGRNCLTCDCVRQGCKGCSQHNIQHRMLFRAD